MLTRKKSLDKNVPTTTRLLKLCKDNAYMIAPAFHGLGVFMPNVIIQTLMLQKLAIQMPNPITSLNSTNDTSKDATNDVQTQAAQCLLVLSLVRQLPSIIVSLQLGPWSDKYGRKFVIMMSITGAILTNVCYLLNSYYLDSSAIYLILSGLPVGLLGDYGAFVMALFGHVKEITNFDSLSPKIAILDGIEMVTSELGPLIGTTLFVNFGFMSVFAGCIIFHGLGILSAYLTISQKPIKICKTMIRDMCHCEGYLQSVRSIVKKRDNNKRTYILVLFMITAIIAFGMSGNMEINYLYTVSKLDWDVTMNTYFIALIGGLAAVGTLVLMPLILHFYRIPDPIFALVGNISFLSFFLGMAFAEDTLSMFLVAVFNIFTGMGLVVNRSIITKCVSNSEIGKIMSLYSVLFAASRTMGQIISTQIFVATITSFIGTYFVAAGSLFIIGIIFSGWMLIDMKRRGFVSQNQSDTVNETEISNESSLSFHNFTPNLSNYVLENDK